MEVFREYLGSRLLKGIEVLNAPIKKFQIPRRAGRWIRKNHLLPIHVNAHNTHTLL
jgi:hypothetical protein